MEEKIKDTFKALNKIDVSDLAKKKGKFTYLSWPYAVQEFLRVCPEATWEPHLFVSQDGVKQPYMKTETGYFVQVSVTVNDITRTQVHPVMNNYNNPIKEPDACDINKSIQRCLAKAIALHGLGLYIFAGEDLPDIGENETQNLISDTQKKEIDELLEMAPLTQEEKDSTLLWMGKTGRTKREADDLIKKLNSKITPTPSTGSVKIGDVVDGVMNSGTTH